MSNPSPGESDRTSGKRSPGGLFLTGAILVAGFLLFGAFAKTYTELTKTEPKAGEAVRAYVHAGVETLLAVLILARCRWAVTWACVSLLFCGFAGATMHRMLGGYSSCGCFGKFAVPPPVTLAIDTAIVMMGVGLARLAGLRGAGAAWVAALAIPMAVSGSLVSRKISEPPPWMFGKMKSMAAAPGPTQSAPAEAAPTPHAQPSPAQPAPTEPQSQAEQGVSPPAAQRSAPAQPEATPAKPEAPPMNAAPPPPQAAPAQAGVDLTAQQDLLNVPARASAALGGKPGPEWLAPLTEAAGDKDTSRAWLLFVYDPDCEVCQRFIPGMQQHMAGASKAPGAKLRVIMLKKSELEKFEIPDWAWPASPTVVLVRGGKIIHEWGAEKTPYSTVLQGEIDKRGGAYLDELEKAHVALTP